MARAETSGRTTILAPMTRSIRRFDTVEEEVAVGRRAIRLIRPRSADALIDEAVEKGRGTPYWAELWPSSRALATLLAGRDLTGLRVVELGCGLALPSVAAALAGAQVLATDREPEALAFASENGRRALGHRLPTLVVDMAFPEPLLERAPFDLVLAADVLYDPANTHALVALLPQLLGPGGEALIAYPWRGQADALRTALEAQGWAAAQREDGGARLLGLVPPRRSLSGGG